MALSRAAATFTCPFDGTADTYVVDNYPSNVTDLTTLAGRWQVDGSGKGKSQYGTPAVVVGSATYANDQYSQFTISTVANDYLGIVVRASADTGSGRDYYLARMVNMGSPDFQVHLFTVTNGTEANPSSGAAASATITWSGGDTLSLEVEGTTLRAYRNYVDSGSTPIVTATDSTWSAGKPGIYRENNIGTSRVDTWIAGDLSSGASAVIPKTAGLFGGPFKRLITY